MEHNYSTIICCCSQMYHKCNIFMVYVFLHMYRCLPINVLHLFGQHLCNICFQCTCVVYMWLNHKCVTFIRSTFIEHLFPMYICCIRVERAMQGGHKWTTCAQCWGATPGTEVHKCITFVVVSTSMVPLMWRVLHCR